MPGVDEENGSGSDGAENELPAGGDGADGFAQDAGGDVPAADDYTPPTREEYEALNGRLKQSEKLASVGSEFAPYANQIRQFIAQGFTPAQAKAEVAKAAAPHEDEDDEFSHPEKYAKMWDKISTDPRAFRKILQREARGASKGEFEKFSSYEKQIKEQGEKIQELLGFATLAQRRFQVDPGFQKHEKRALELVNSGKVMDLNLAFEVAEREAKLKEYEAKAGVSTGAQAARKLSAKPAPRDDKSLHESRSAKGRTRGVSEPVADTKGKSRSRAALEAAAREVGM